MKKTLIYILAAAVALGACTPESFESQKGIPSDHTSISLKPVVVGPVTKADEPATEDGDGDYNENLISSYYWFIFSDAAGTELKLSGHETTGDAKEILLDDVFPTGGVGYVYVVANLPEKPEGTGDAEWFEYVAATETAPAGIKHVVRSGSDETSHTYAGTLETLKTLEFGKNTPVVNNAIVAGQSEFYNYTSATTGLPAPEKFVMRTADPIKFTLIEKTAVPVTAGLKRVAAKIILDLNVAQEVEQTHTNAAGLEEYTKTWYADIEHIQIYMLWGSTHANLEGAPVSYSTENQSWFYFASPRYAMYKSPDGGNYNASTNTVEGAVPDTAYSETEFPVSSSVWEVVYQIAQDENNEPIWDWKSGIAEEDKIDENIGNITYGNWRYILDENNNKIPALDADGNIQRRLTTVTEDKPYYAISSIPMYTMPIEWNVNDAHAPFIKIILPWQGYNKETGEYDMKNGARKTTEFYYKILVPNRTTLDANNCYHISLDLSVLGSEADEVPVELNGEYHVVKWNEPVAMGGDQSAGRYLNCATHFEFYSQNVMNIPVNSSHDISVVLTGTNAPSATYSNYSANTVTTGSLTLSDASSTGDNYQISASGTDKVTVSHTLETTLASMASRDVAPITYTFRIQHSDNASYFKDITVVQYPSMYIVSDANSGGTSTTNRGYVYVNGTDRNTNSNNWYVVRSTWSSQGSNTNQNMYIVTASVLNNSSDNLVIGDPRGLNTVTAGNPTWASAPGVEGTASRQLSSNYLGAENSEQAANMVAPKLRVASSWGAAGSYSYDNAKRRCASYQEDGLPAGRWRLPTAGEIKYLVNLSANSLLPLLFGAAGESTTYWSANGTVTVNGSTVTTSTTTTGNNYIRCVYDEWYWGETKNSDTVRATYRGTFYWGDEYSAN